MNEQGAFRVDPPSTSAPLARRGRVLVDLSHAADGFVGIAQDTRLVFDMLSTIETVSVAGLLMATGRHDLPRITAKGRASPAAIAGVLHWMGKNWSVRKYRRFGRWTAEAPELLRTDYQLRAMVGPSNAVWRTLFDKTLSPLRRSSVLSQQFLATDLSVMRVIDRTLALPFLPPKRLDAQDFDFVLFCMPRPVRLPSGVRQLVRFHDAVPLTDVDTQSTWQSALAHQQLTRRCEPDAVFICNSPQSLADLVALDPSRARHARVIPCALAPLPHEDVDVPIASVLYSRRSARALGASDVLAPLDPAMRYVLTIGTLEPRKNIVGLIRAWERVVSRSDPELRLVIVGNKGWQDADILLAMQPHVASGRIVHLEKLPLDELIAVARHAACFAFPSFNEGFGYPPLEALQAETVSLVSDIPIFRWTFGEGALYVDPYDVDSIASGIERLAVHEGREALRRELLTCRTSILERFAVDTIRDEWEALIDSLLRERTRR